MPEVDVAAMRRLAEAAAASNDPGDPAHFDLAYWMAENVDAILAALERAEAAMHLLKEAETREQMASARLERMETALKALNSAVWKDFPQWAITSPETAQASAALEGQG